MRYKTAKTAGQATGDAAIADAKEALDRANAVYADCHRALGDAADALAEAGDAVRDARDAYDTARAHYDDALAEAEATARVRDS